MRTTTPRSGAITVIILVACAWMIATVFDQLLPGDFRRRSPFILGAIVASVLIGVVGSLVRRRRRRLITDEKL
jgi:uncharacterized membrane protein YvlD (DUF360 family)